jgi:predicted NBD/HSP70 family sugar kinase
MLKQFDYLRTVYAGEEITSLEDEYLETLQDVIKWVVDDAGEELGFEILADLFVDLDVEVIKIWIQFIQILFEKRPGNPNIILNSIGCLLAAKEKFGNNITPDNFVQFLIDEIAKGRSEGAWVSDSLYELQ